MEDKRRADIETNAKLEELFLAAAPCLFQLRQCKVQSKIADVLSKVGDSTMISQFYIVFHHMASSEIPKLSIL